MFVYPISERVRLNLHPQVLVATNVHALGCCSFGWPGKHSKFYDDGLNFLKVFQFWWKFCDDGFMMMHLNFLAEMQQTLSPFNNNKRMTHLATRPACVIFCISVVPSALCCNNPLWVILAPLGSSIVQLNFWFELEEVLALICFFFLLLHALFDHHHQRDFIIALL